MTFSQIDHMIHQVDDLPTLPRTVLKITELVNNPKSSARDLSDVITDDQVLTARLLRLVNSSFYGFPQKISTVTSAIVLLGFDAIRNLLLSSSVLIFLPETTRNAVAKASSYGIIPSQRQQPPRPSDVQVLMKRSRNCLSVDFFTILGKSFR